MREGEGGEEEGGRRERGRKERGRKERGRKERGRKGKRREGKEREGKERKERGRKERGRRERGREERGRKERGRRERGREEWEGRVERGPAVSWPEDSQLPEVVGCFMIASDKQGGDGGHLLTRVVLCMVEPLILTTSSHAVLLTLPCRRCSCVGTCVAQPCS